MLKFVLTTTLALGAATAVSAHDVDAYPAGTYEKVAAAFPEGDYVTVAYEGAVAHNVDMFSTQDVTDIKTVYQNDFGVTAQDSATDMPLVGAGS